MSAPETPAVEQPKKPYRSPVIRHYGAIRTITEDVGNMGNQDGGFGRNKRTEL